MDNTLKEIQTIVSEGLGNLSFFEIDQDLPFQIKRIYYIYNVPTNHKRGMHAHKKLKQVLWCPFGEIEVVLDNGETKTSYILDSPSKVLIIIKGYWREIFWKMKNSVLCVGASEYYDENDYIRDYNIFKKLAKERFWDNEN